MKVDVILQLELDADQWMEAHDVELHEVGDDVTGYLWHLVEESQHFKNARGRVVKE